MQRLDFSDDLLFHFANVNLFLALTYQFDIGHRRVFLAFEKRVDFLDCLAFGLNPVHRLGALSAVAFN